MKRFLALALPLFLLTAPLSGCSGPDMGDGAGPGVSLSIVCTTFPQYDWIRQILGDKLDNHTLHLLLSGRADLHSYQPSVDDIVKISACDLFVYVGGESDGWVEGILKNAQNPDMVVISLLELLGDGAKTEETVEGMETEEDDEPEYNEHVWLSLRNAAVFCAAIADAFSALDKDGAAEYQANLSAYAGDLSALEAQYQAAVSAAPVQTLVFADRFPFQYLFDDYGLAYYAAFPGCSAETEASFATVIFLAGKIDAFNLKTVLVTESSDQSIAKTVIGNTREKNQKILVLDSMQSVTGGEARNGVTYLSVMEGNLAALREALE